MSKLLLPAVALIALTEAQDTPLLCAWAQGRAGTVRDALYLDGGYVVNNTWSASKWENTNPRTGLPEGYLFKFNYSTPFRYQDQPPDLGSLLGRNELGADGARINVPLYRGGTMLTDDFELYTFGQVH
jgi:hypothetical protein